MCKYLCADMPYFQRPRHSSKIFIHITAVTDFESRLASKSYTTHSTHVNSLLLFLSKAHLHTTVQIHWSDIYIAVHNYSDSIIHYSLSLYIHSYTSVHSYIHSYAKFTIFIKSDYFTKPCSCQTLLLGMWHGCTYTTM